MSEYDRLKKQKDSILAREKHTLKIGKFELRIITVPEGDSPPFHDEQHVWIQHEDGEGLSTRVSNLEELVEKFFHENL